MLKTVAIKISSCHRGTINPVTKRLGDGTSRTWIVYTYAEKEMWQIVIWPPVDRELRPGDIVALQENAITNPQEEFTTWNILG